MSVFFQTFVSVKLMAAMLYVWMQCIREVTFLHSYGTQSQVYLENYMNCGFYYWLTSTAQYCVSFMLVWATIKRILSLRHKR